MADVPLKPNPMADPEYCRLMAEGRRLQQAGASRKEFSKPFFAAGRLRAKMNRLWRESLPDADRATLHIAPSAGGKDPLEAAAVDKAIYLASEWSPQGVQLLMRLAEGTKCACCSKCKVAQPDLKAISTLTGLLQDAIKLRIAQMEARSQRRTKAEVVEIGWAAEGDKA